MFFDDSLEKTRKIKHFSKMLREVPEAMKVFSSLFCFIAFNYYFIICEI